MWHRCALAGVRCVHKVDDTMVFSNTYVIFHRDRADSATSLLAYVLCINALLQRNLSVCRMLGLHIELEILLQERPVKSGCCLLLFTWLAVRANGHSSSLQTKGV